MGTIYQQVTLLITTNPGNILYHLVLAFSILGTAQTAFTVWRQESFPQGRRMVLGLGLLLVLRLLLSIGALFSLVGLFNPHTLLPNADRAITVLSLVIILWLWVYPEPMRLADVASGMLTIFVLTFYIMIQSWWRVNSTEINFNSTFAAFGWEILSLVVLAMGILLLIIRKPNGWSYGLGMLGTLAIGHVLQMVFPALTSDFPGTSRLFEMAGYPLLWTIPNRFNLPKVKLETTTPEEEKSQEAPSPPIQETPQAPSSPVKNRITINPQVFRDILLLVDNTTQETIHQKFSKLMAKTMLADLCLLIFPPDNQGRLFIQCAYDLVRQIYLPSTQIDSKEVPMLVQAMKRGRPLRFPDSSTSPDSKNIAKALDLEYSGYTLAAFMPSAGGHDYPKMGILLISSRDEHHWDRDDQAFLNTIATNIAPIFEREGLINSIKNNLLVTEESLTSTQTVLAEAKDKMEELEKSNQEQKNEKDVLLERLSKAQQRFDTLQGENQRLQTKVDNLKEALKEQAKEPQQLKEELKLTLTEIAQLRNQLADAEIEAAEEDDSRQITTAAQGKAIIKKLGKGAVDLTDDVLGFLSIIQDLRQPMSSIVGYTDLLLSESAGILGAVQRKFLERIQASAQRMELYLKDLYQAVPHNGGEMVLRPEVVDLTDVIDATIAETQGQFQERGIVLRLDLPDEMPCLHADQDALQQILIHLLNNAGTATPKNGEIFFRASTYRAEDDYVLIQVADQGGGIHTDDLPRVFSRLYRADDARLPGIGESGVALSIVKALVEAHKGRIWVDTEMGKGSTITLLIPLDDGNDGPYLSQQQATINSEGNSP